MFFDQFQDLLAVFLAAIGIGRNHDELGYALVWRQLLHNGIYPFAIGELQEFRLYRAGLLRKQAGSEHDKTKEKDLFENIIDIVFKL